MTTLSAVANDDVAAAAAVAYRFCPWIRLKLKLLVAWAEGTRAVPATRISPATRAVLHRRNVGFLTRPLHRGGRAPATWRGRCAGRLVTRRFRHGKAAELPGQAHPAVPGP